MNAGLRSSVKNTFPVRVSSASRVIAKRSAPTSLLTNVRAPSDKNCTPREAASTDGARRSTPAMLMRIALVMPVPQMIGIAGLLCTRRWSAR
jgi:hypothetical protein